MKTGITKRAWSVFLALALMVTAVFGNVTTAKAATTDYVTLVQEYGTAQAGVETAQYSFTVDKACPVDVGFYVPATVGVTVKLYKAGTEYDSVYIASTNTYWSYVASLSAFDNGWTVDLASGDYSVSLTFDSETEYILYVDAYAAEAKINQEKAVVTVGYTTKLSVENGTVKSWSSSNKSIATVDKNGKVTGKKASSKAAVITATLTDGTKLKCKVYVKSNKYTDEKISVNDANYNQCIMNAYSAAFDKSGNLVIKVRFANNTPNRVVELSGIKVTVKNESGKTVGTYKLSSKKVSISGYSTKDFTFTIKKSSLKKKKADLRNSTIVCDGSYYYYR